MARRPEARSRGGTELLYGVHPVAEALGARRRRLVRLVLRRGRRGRVADLLRARAEGLGVPVEELDEPEYWRLAPADSHTQGVLLEVGPLPGVSLEALAGPGPGAGGGGPGAAGSGEEPFRALSEKAPSGGAVSSGAAPGESALLVALDEVQDPQNLGAIARVAEGAGARGLLVSERRAAPASAAASRASAGALEVLPAARVGNLARALDLLRQWGWWVIGADPEAADDLYAQPDAAFAGRVCVVLGAEGRGLRPGVRRRVDHLVRVPMAGRLASLNVAATAAIVCFEWVRRTRGGDAGGRAAALADPSGTPAPPGAISPNRKRSRS